MHDGGFQAILGVISLDHRKLKQVAERIPAKEMRGERFNNTAQAALDHNSAAIS